jgi:hypothetical protein
MIGGGPDEKRNKHLLNVTKMKQKNMKKFTIT